MATSEGELTRVRSLLIASHPLPTADMLLHTSDMVQTSLSCTSSAMTSRGSEVSERPTTQTRPSRTTTAWSISGTTCTSAILECPSHTMSQQKSSTRHPHSSRHTRTCHRMPQLRHSKRLRQRRLQLCRHRSLQRDQTPCQYPAQRQSARILPRNSRGTRLDHRRHGTRRSIRCVNRSRATMTTCGTTRLGVVRKSASSRRKSTRPCRLRRTTGTRTS